MLTGSRLIGLFERGNYTFYFTRDRFVGTGIRLSNIDLERGTSSDISSILSFCNFEDESTRVRVVSNFKSTSEFIIPTGRDDALKELGRNVFDNFIFIERKLPLYRDLTTLFNKNISYDKLADEIIESIDLDWFESNDVIFKPVSVKEIRLFSLDPVDEIRLDKASLEFRGQHVSTVRLWEPSSSDVPENSLGYLREELGPHHIFSTTIRKKDRAKVLLGLKRKQKQTEISTNMVDATQNEGAQVAQADLEFNDTDIFDIDVNVLFYGNDMKEVEKRASRGRSKLLRLGYFKRETSTQFSSFTGSLLGSSPNYGLIEDGKHIDQYIPLIGRAPSKCHVEGTRAMAVNRASFDVEYLDLFSPKNSNYSAIIIGKMGLGKSVLLNTLIQSMLNDPDLKIMLVDVRGSFKRTVNKYKNNTYNFKLNEATGLNPFRVVSLENVDISDKVEMLKHFIATLIKKDDEKNLDSELMAEIEESLTNYCSEKPGFPGISDFVKKYPNLPRYKTLSRWITGGVFEHVFKGTINPKDNAVISYYNFEEIFTAADPEISKAVISAITCDYNIRLLSKKLSDRLVFIADETPFFVKESFDFFKLTNKNVRKLYGSMILAAQSSSDLVVNGDTSLIDNVDTKFLFSVDSRKTDYKELFNLNEEQYQQIANCEKVRSNNSAFILQDILGFRQCYLELTKEEYWNSTSKPDDVEKIQRIKELIPGLTDRECYRILERGAEI